MTKAEILLALLVALAVVRIVQAELTHRALLRLLGDLATMIGELFDVIGAGND